MCEVCVCVVYVCVYERRDPTCGVYGGGGPRADSAPGTMSGAPRDPFYSSPFGPFYRRHAPTAAQPQYRIHELNKRLQSRSEVRMQSIGGPGSGPRVLELLLYEHCIC